MTLEACGGRKLNGFSRDLHRKQLGFGGGLQSRWYCTSLETKNTAKLERSNQYEE